MSGPLDQLRKIVYPPEELVDRIAKTIDGYTAENPQLTMIEVLAAFEYIRFQITEKLIQIIMK